MSRNTSSSRRITFYLVLAVLMAFGLGAVWVYFQSQQVPEFYQRAKSRATSPGPQSTEQPRINSAPSTGTRPSTGSEQKLNRLLATLTGTASGRTEADEWLSQLIGDASATRIHEVFGEDDINAWLARELPRRFQHCLPPGVSDPQVEFSIGRGRVGFRYQQGGLEGVVTLDVDVAMTGRGSQLAVHLRGISVGSLPLPVGKVLDLISDAGTRSQGPSYRGPDVVTWTRQGGEHVALLPGSGPGGGYFNMLESFSLRDGEVEVVIKRQPSQRR